MLGDLQRLITRELESFQREIELFPDDESVWRTAPGVANSAGNLAMHVCGGLQHFLGTVLGGTGYVRDREAEFGRRHESRAVIVAELRTTIGVVESVLSGPAERWIGKPFPVALYGLQVRTEIFLLHLATHAAFHLGQAGYLRRLLLEDPRSSGPLALTALADPPATARSAP
jgi:hypothetical protein